MLMEKNDFILLLSEHHTPVATLRATAVQHESKSQPVLYMVPKVRPSSRNMEKGNILFHFLVLQLHLKRILKFYQYYFHIFFYYMTI